VKLAVGRGGELVGLRAFASRTDAVAALEGEQS
jgi:hypothetical protein